MKKLIMLLLLLVSGISFSDTCKWIKKPNIFVTKEIELIKKSNLKGKVYLLTTNGNILRNGIILNNNNIDINNGKVLSLDNTFKGEIYIISTDKVFNFVKEAYKNKNILISDLILQWFEYLE